MQSTKKTLLKTAIWEIYHVAGIAGIVYLVTGEWEYVGLAALGYLLWEAFGYFSFEMLWAKFWNRKGKQ